MQEFAEKFYNSPAWKKCRIAYSKSQGGLCEMCRKMGRIVPGEIVHHKVPLTPSNIENPNITLSFDSLMLLCRDHHAEIHKKNVRRYDVDPEGRVTIRE